MKKPLALIALALVGCSVDQATDDDVDSTTASIVGGTTTSAYPAVGALVEQGEPFCTGTVVAPRVVVTAAHCLEGESAANISFAFGPNAYHPSSVIHASAIHVHPDYDAQSITSDIGVVVLSQDAPVTPIPMNTTALDSTWVGQSLTFVGYGVTNGTTQAGAGTKRQVAIPVAQVGSTQFAYTGSKNTCFGDSGGPALGKNASNATVLVGTTSYGDSRCRQYGVDTRVDAFRTFVNQYVN